MEPALRLVVGLGNPSPSYQNTRHNVGREFIDEISRQSKSSFEKDRQAEIIRLPAFFGIPLEVPLLFGRFTCFMNESGGPLKKIMDREQLTPQQILVVVDDFMIPFGSLRMRLKGSSGGHNGLNSINDVLGTEDYPRLRVGIGPVPEGDDPARFVLERFTKDEISKLPALFESVKEGLSFLVLQGWQKTMSAMNKAHL